MKSKVVQLGVFLLSAGVGLAQPTVGGALNNASYKLTGLPGDGVAQGSIFAVFGTNMGNGATASGFPLPTELGGTKLTLTVNNVSKDAYLIYAFGGQLAAVMPSDMPVGNGLMTVRFNGQASAPAPIKIVAHGLGIFTWNAAGTGAGIAVGFGDNVNGEVVTATKPARPGKRVDFYATGLTGVPFPDNVAAQGMDFKDSLNVKVFVGGKEAQVLYAGRSGCCSGLDQIVVVLPDNISGCFVSVVIYVDGLPSNYVTLPVASSGACSDANFLSSSEVSAVSSGTARVGVVDLTRVAGKITFQGMTLTTTEDVGGATFQRYDNGLFTQRAVQTTSVGSCIVYSYTSSQGDFTDSTPYTPLGAGTIMVSGNGTSKTLDVVSKGNYSKVFASSTGGLNIPNLPPGIEIPGIGGSDTPFLEPGTFTVSGSAGADVGSFMASVTIPGNFNWTNQDAIAGTTVIARSADLPITWTGAGANDFVQIIGSSLNGDTGAAFYCTERGSAGQFSVPSEVLSALPASGSVSGTATGALIVATSAAPVRFNASGLDLGFLVYSAGQTRIGLNFQ